MTFEIMNFMRTLRTDRTTAIAIAVAVIYLFLVQIFIAGFSQGAMAATAPNPLNVICSSSGTIIILPDGSTSPAKTAPDCPCGLLCRLASTYVIAFPYTPEPFNFVQLAEGQTQKPSPKAILTPSLKGVIAEPRAPPTVS